VVSRGKDTRYGGELARLWEKAAGPSGDRSEPVETCRDTPDKHGMEVRIKE